MKALRVIVATYLLVTVAPARKDRMWATGTFGTITSDSWCKTPPSLVPGPCDPLRGVPSFSDPPSPARAGDASFPGTPAVLIRPMTDIIKVEGSQAIYTVKYTTPAARLPFAAGDSLDFSVEGKHLYLRVLGKVYKTDVIEAHTR